MTEKTMTRRRRYHQRHKRGIIATRVIGTACAFTLVVLAVMWGVGYINNQPPLESIGTLDQALNENKISSESVQTVYEDGTDWKLRLVNRQNPLPEGYTVTLKELPGGEKIDERIYDPLMEMLEAAKEDNWDELPRVISGYRTQEVQQSLYDDEVNKNKSKGCSEEEARAEAGKWVAVPGTSEHQLGLAVDIEGATYDVFIWLQENSYKYGFIFRYPGSKSDITGTVEEVWHYRYVGVDAATKMYEQGLCLEEYLG